MLDNLYETFQKIKKKIDNKLTSLSSKNPQGDQNQSAMLEETLNQSDLSMDLIYVYELRQNLPTIAMIVQNIDNHDTIFAKKLLKSMLFQLNIIFDCENSNLVGENGNSEAIGGLDRFTKTCGNLLSY